jgi:hypothetical protein
MATALLLATQDGTDISTRRLAVSSTTGEQLAVSQPDFGIAAWWSDALPRVSFMGLFNDVFAHTFTKVIYTVPITVLEWPYTFGFDDAVFPDQTNTALALTALYYGKYYIPFHNQLVSGNYEGYTASRWNSYAGSVSAGAITDAGISADPGSQVFGGITYEYKNASVTMSASIAALRLHCVKKGSDLAMYWEGDLTLMLTVTADYYVNSDLQYPVSANSSTYHCKIRRDLPIGELSVYGDYLWVSGDDPIPSDLPVDTASLTVTISAS